MEALVGIISTQPPGCHAGSGLLVITPRHSYSQAVKVWVLAFLWRLVVGVMSWSCLPNHVFKPVIRGVA